MLPGPASRFASASLLALCCATAAADEPLADEPLADEPSAAIAKMLDIGWSVTPQARQASDDQYEIISAAAPASLPAAKARWLVLMQQRRFDEALKQVELYLDRQPDDLTALRARAWLLAILKNYPAAIAAADTLSRQLATEPPKDDAERTLHEDCITFLGRLAGYFGGPAADNVDQDQRKAFEKRILDRLPETQRPRLENARNAVLARFIEILDESSATRDRTKALAAAEKAKTLADLQTEKSKIDDRGDELADRQKKLNDELRAELANLDKQELPLVQQQNQLAGRLEFLNADLLGCVNQMLALEQLAVQEKDPVLKQQYLTQASALSLVTSRIESDIYNINRLLRTVQVQRVAVQNRRRQAQGGAASQVERLQREQGDLDRRQRRNEGIERRVGRAAPGSTGKERSLAAQATALSTYDAFPLEAEKLRLLEALK